MRYRRFILLPIFAGILSILILNILFNTVGYFSRNTSVIYRSFYFGHFYLLNAWWFIGSYLINVPINKITISFYFNSIRVYAVKEFTFLILASVVYLFYFSELRLLWLYIISTILCYGISMAIKFLIGRHQSIMQQGSKRVIILGYNETAKKLARYLEEDANCCIVGFAENNENVNELAHYPIISDIYHTVEVSKRLRVNEIFLTIMPEQNNYLYDLIYEAESEYINISLVPNLASFIKKPAYIHYIGDMPVLLLRSESAAITVKRFLDVFVSVIVIVFILSWLLPIISLIIYLDSPGPVFLKQIRTGSNNRQIVCFTFRCKNDCYETDSKMSLSESKSITTAGRILRKTNLDMLPLFFNVLKGDMSLVGPRPPLLKHTEDYSKVINHYMMRYFLKPGLTGWTHIKGIRGEIANVDLMKKKMEYDLWYLENWSLWLDFKIVLLTFWIGISDRGIT
jgi:putative colanic acid biosynthesis UDP-glucose lipid carrier transferase